MTREETERLGEALGALALGTWRREGGACCNGIPAARTVLLYGGLGAGKTAFVTGYAKGLGSVDAATSPTYAIANTYRCGVCGSDGDDDDGSAGVWLHHFDAYRLDGPDAMDETGFWDYIGGPRCAVAVEWAERLKDSLDGYERTTVSIRPSALAECHAGIPDGIDLGSPGGVPGQSDRCDGADQANGVDPCGLDDAQFALPRLIEIRVYARGLSGGARGMSAAGVSGRQECGS